MTFYIGSLERIELKREYKEKRFWAQNIFNYVVIGMEGADENTGHFNMFFMALFSPFYNTGPRFKSGQGSFLKQFGKIQNRQLRRD